MKDQELQQLLSTERRQHNATRAAWKETIRELEELRRELQELRLIDELVGETLTLGPESGAKQPSYLARWGRLERYQSTPLGALRFLLRSLSDESEAPMDTPLERLKAAIRLFTAEGRDAAGELAPNGSKHETTMDKLCDHPYMLGAPPEVAELFSQAMTTSGDDCQELREAAERYFGEDFRAGKPQPLLTGAEFLEQATAALGGGLRVEDLEGWRSDADERLDELEKRGGFSLLDVAAAVVEPPTKVTLSVGCKASPDDVRTITTAKEYQELLGAPPDPKWGLAKSSPGDDLESVAKERGAAEDRRIAELEQEEAPQRRAEVKAAIAEPETKARCDGDHAMPPCADPGCWHRDARAEP